LLKQSKPSNYDKINQSNELAEQNLRESDPNLNSKDQAKDQAMNQDFE